MLVLFYVYIYQLIDCIVLFLFDNNYEGKSIICYHYNKLPVFWFDSFFPAFLQLFHAAGLFLSIEILEQLLSLNNSNAKLVRIEKLRINFRWKLPVKKATGIRKRIPSLRFLVFICNIRRQPEVHIYLNHGLNCRHRK